MPGISPTESQPEGELYYTDVKVRAGLTEEQAEKLRFKQADPAPTTISGKATQLRLANWGNETVFDFDTLFRDQSKLTPRSILFERPRRNELILGNTLNFVAFRKLEDIGPVASHQEVDSDLVKLGGFQGELNTWHDMSFVNFHSKAVCHVPEDFYSPSPSLPSFYQGSAEFTTSELLEEAENAIRFMAEDCDILGEFHLMVDAVTSFGGFSSALMEQVIADEYPKALIRTWANFTNCQDLEFGSTLASNALVASALTKLSEWSTQLVPILLHPSDAIHHLHDEEISLSNAVHASAVHAAALDIVATKTLIGEPYFSPDVLTEYKLATPVHSFTGEPRFTSLATGHQKVISAWEQKNVHKRMNHREDTFPGSTATAADFPIYSPNFLYTGYQQQASSGFAILEPHSESLSRYLKDFVLRDLKRFDFGEIDDAADTFSQVKESICSLINQDDE